MHRERRFNCIIAKCGGDKMKNRDILQEWENVRVSEKWFLLALLGGVVFCFIALILVDGV